MLHSRKLLMVISLLILTIAATTVLTADERDECCEMVGDIDHNGYITVGDLVGLTNFIYSGGPPPLCWDEGNIDYDPFGRINQRDLLLFESYFPNSGPCGISHSADTISGLTLYLNSSYWPVSEELDYAQFEIYLRYTTSELFNSFSNGFKIYSPNGVQWNTVNAEFISYTFGSTDYTSLYTDVSGEGTDIIGFSGYDNEAIAENLNPDLDYYAYRISVGPIDPVFISDTICIDSSWFPYENAWLWNTNSPFKAVIPEWGGPYCFPIEPCCNYNSIRGDINLDHDINVADIVDFVNYLFKGGPPPPCFQAADVDVDGDLLVSDIVLLANYLFKGGPPPPPC